MASTLWRNVSIAARSRVYPPGARYRQRERLIQHNTEMTPLFRPLRLRGGQPGPGADLGCTGWEGWCTSRPVSWISGVLSKPKFAGEGAAKCCELWIRDTSSRSIGNRMSQSSGLMLGKRGVILGVANNRSIAWGTARACHAAGGEI